MRQPLIQELAYLHVLQGVLRDRLRRGRETVDQGDEEDRGDQGSMSAEAMIIIGILVATAITALGIIAAKIVAKARSIDLG